MAPAALARQPPGRGFGCAGPVVQAISHGMACFVSPPPKPSPEGFPIRPTRQSHLNARRQPWRPVQLLLYRAHTGLPPRNPLFLGSHHQTRLFANAGSPSIMMNHGGSAAATPSSPPPSSGPHLSRSTPGQFPVLRSLAVIQTPAPDQNLQPDSTRRPRVSRIFLTSDISIQSTRLAVRSVSRLPIASIRPNPGSQAGHARGCNTVLPGYAPG